MELLSSGVDKLKAFTKSSQNFVDGLIHARQNSTRRNPIEILKRLQREAFSDLMKLRDRQDKVERIVSFYKTSERGPFQEASTHVRGEVDVLGALLMMDNVDLKNCDGDTVDKVGLGTGVETRFTFETTIRQKDTLLAEFVASQKGKGDLGEVLGSPLSLAKVLYMANVTDWFSVVAVPVGAQCRDIAISTNVSHQGKGLTDFSSFGPPLLNPHYGGAISLMVRKSNIVASLAQFVSRLGMRPGSDRMWHCFSTFGRVVFQLPRGTKLSLLGLHHMPKSSSQHVSLGPLTIAIGSLKHRDGCETPVAPFTPPMGTTGEETVSAGSIALMLESDLDESTRVKGWIEMTNSNPRNLQWAITMSDDSEDDIGWGFSFSGKIGCPKSWDRFQVESYARFHLGKRFSLQPGVAYIMDGTTRIPALMLRSHWSL